MRCIKSKETVESAEKPLQDPSKTSCSYVNETLSIRHKSTLNWYIVLKKTVMQLFLGQVVRVHLVLL